MDEKTSVSVPVDLSDCLEATGAFKKAKNLFFLIAFLSLIVLQGIFWLNYLGYIEGPEGSVKDSKVEAKADNPDAGPVESNAKKPDGEVKTARDEAKNGEDIEKHAGNAVADVNGGAESSETEESAGIAETEETETSEAKSEEKTTFEGRFARFIPDYQQSVAAIKICNFLVIISVTIYCLILLMSLKISLAGRLGGINSISRAFLLSLYGLILLFPWQSMFEGVVLGAVYLPKELFSWTLTSETSVFCQGLYFARFSGIWVLVVLLLLGAQIKSAKWVKTTRSRIKVIG